MTEFAPNKGKTIEAEVRGIRYLRLPIKTRLITSGDDLMKLLEEYVAVRDYDCDGVTQLAVEVYPVGYRPALESRTQELEA